ncbi:MAG: hypothetical protein KKA73_01570 [Chloroflexi bacterium]|nr:hypothetical protein [Chloroflexota bacterium]MBU1746353.1 hypothetical protein [Chloroflexota bacterium]
MTKRAARSKSEPLPDPASLRAQLESDYPDRRWFTLLELFLPVGVADTLQMRTATGLTRDQLNRLLARLETQAGNAILARVPFNVPRPGARGRSPVVYTLGPTGAALLRAGGHHEAQPCGLTKDVAIAHAQAVLDVRQAALKAHLPVQTEREVAYGAGHALRPDNVITLPGQRRAILEVEQMADISQLRRIEDSLRHKAAFFQSGAAREFSPTVRVLINLPPSREWDGTVQVWERAAAIVAEKCGGRLPFRLVAYPLLRFLDRPDWTEPPGSAWESLFDPAQTASFAPAPPEKAIPSRPTAPAARSLPAPLARRAARDDALVLLAFWQAFQERAPGLGNPEVPQPEPAFFQVMRIIYAASHDAYAPLQAQAAHPYASLYLLRQYLGMHPALHEALSKGMVRGSSSVKWGVPTILLRMQTIIQTFMRYHGWRTTGPLRVYSELASWDEEERRGTFAVTAYIRDPELLMGPGDGIVPSQEEARQVGAALAWVLLSLFVHAEDLDLKRPPFW